MRENVESITEAMFALEEPWRGRFLALLANQATGGAWNGQRPERKEVMTWLRDDLDLYREVTLLLNAWRRPGR